MSSTTSSIDTRPMPFVVSPEPSAGSDMAFSRALLDRIREGLVRFERDLTVRSANRSWLHMIGWDGSEVRGRNLSELLDAGDLERLQAAMTALVDDDSAGVEPLELRLTWRSADGRRIESHTVLFAAREATEPDALGGWVWSGLVHDLTVENLAAEERRKLRERVGGPQRNESLGILAGGLAHDFNNVLTAILGLVDVARLQLPRESEVRPVLQEISKTADYAAILVRNLLAYAGKGKSTTEIVELSSLVRDQAQWVIHNLHLEAEVEVSCAAGLPSMLGDPAQIQQAVTNLVMNAAEALAPSAFPADASRREPRIRIETGMTQVDGMDLQRAVFATRPRSGSYLFVEVWDNGCGIDPASIPRIFDPFFTTKLTGRGLGLAAVQGIVYGHGGFLKVDSELHRGTAVRLHLPIPRPTGEDSGDESEAGALRGPGEEQSLGRILVVDDEEAVRGIAQATLQMAGYEVVLAGDGQEGWETVRERPDDFAAVLLDITMPRMTGDEMLAKVRELRPRLPVLLSSGFASNEACFRTIDDPFTSFLKKPYRTRELKQEIADLLASADDPSNGA